MPTYEYRCKGCGRQLEVVQAFTDDALTTCDDCGGDLKKVFGNVGISFKGSGFYKTDSRSTSSVTSGSGGGSDKATADKGGADKASSGSDSGSSADTGAKASTTASSTTG